jgi:hypothetical protein
MRFASLLLTVAAALAHVKMPRLAPDFLTVERTVRLSRPGRPVGAESGDVTANIRIGSARAGSPLLQSAEVLRGRIDTLLRRTANP